MAEKKVRIKRPTITVEFPDDAALELIRARAKDLQVSMKAYLRSLVEADLKSAGVEADLTMKHGGRRPYS